MRHNLEQLVGSYEKIICKGKPDKQGFIFENVFNGLFVLAVVWTIFEYLLISSSGGFRKFFGYRPIGSLVLFSFISIPVIIYIVHVLMLRRRYVNMAFVITDKALYISRGIFSYYTIYLSYAEISNIKIHRSYFDKVFNVADIILASTSSVIEISCVSEFEKVYNIIKKLKKDTHDDIMNSNNWQSLENNENRKGGGSLF